MSTDSERLAAERLSKFNSVMTNTGFQDSATAAIPQPDRSSLLTRRDVEKMQQSLAARQPDSYICAGVMWLLRSIGESLRASHAAPPAFDQQQQQQQQQQKAAASAAQIQKQAAADQAAAEKRDASTELEPSKDGRTLKLRLSREETANLHPKVGDVRTSIMDLEKATHDSLDRVMRARLKFLTLSNEEPPCMREMKRAADCYAHFAQRKHEAAQYLQKQESVPDVVRRQQLQQQAAAAAGATATATATADPKKKKKAAPEQHPYATLPPDLLAESEVVKLSTSVLSCRDHVSKFEQCTEQAALRHVSNNHGQGEEH